MQFQIYVEKSAVIVYVIFEYIKYVETMKNLTEFVAESNNGYKPIHKMDAEETGRLWDEVAETIGQEKMLNEIFQALDIDTRVWLLETINNMYDLEIEELV